MLCGVVSHSCQVWGNETDLSLSVVWCGEPLMSSMGNETDLSFSVVWCGESLMSSMG